MNLSICLYRKLPYSLNLLYFSGFLPETPCNKVNKFTIQAFPADYLHLKVFHLENF